MNKLTLAIWVVIGLLAAWFITMSVNRNIFTHNDIDSSVQGTTVAKYTDIGTQCGDIDANSPIEYKLSQSGKIMYLCPQGWWPIQQTVTAATVTDAFKRSLRPNQLTKVETYYPTQPAQPAGNPFVAQ